MTTSTPTARVSMGRALADAVVNVDDAGLEYLTAAEGEQLAGDFGGARGLLHDVEKFGFDGQGELMVQREFAGEADGLGDVVEVVGDAACEAAYGFHAMGVAELLFQFALAGDVYEHSPGCIAGVSRSPCRDIRRERRRMMPPSFLRKRVSKLRTLPAVYSSAR